MDSGKRASYSSRQPTTAVDPQDYPASEYAPRGSQPAYPPNPPQNGVSRSGSHRRRDSHAITPVDASKPMNLPAAPDAPRPGPPISYKNYKDPYGLVYRDPYTASAAAAAAALPPTETRTYVSRSHARPAPPKAALPTPPATVTTTTTTRTRTSTSSRDVPTATAAAAAASPTSAPTSAPLDPASPLPPISPTMQGPTRASGPRQQRMSVASTSSAAGTGQITGSSVRPERRRSSVPDRSPLQKLEVKLDDISKEEKRARLQEAELVAQERAALARATSRSLQDAGAAGVGAAGVGVVGRARHVSGPVPETEAVAAKKGLEATEARRASREKRYSSLPTNGLVTATVGESSRRAPQYPQTQTQDSKRVTAASTTKDPYYDRDPALAEGRHRHSAGVVGGLTGGGSSSGKSQLREPVSSQKAVEATSKAYEEPAERRRSASGMIGGLSQAGGSFKDREAQARTVTAGPATGLGLTGVEDVPYNKSQPPLPTDVGRRESRKLSKGPPLHKPMNIIRGAATGEGAAKARGASVTSEPVPPKGVLSKEPTGPKYEVTPQTAEGRKAREQVAFANNEPEAPPQQRRHHISSPFHRHQEPDRRYAAAGALNEWKDGVPARLLGDDLNLDAPVADRGTAWWEKDKDKSRRRRSGQPDAPRTQYPANYADPSYDERTGQTSFNPPLYLKAGPLLRCTGIQRDCHLGGRISDLWRGSVLIVTIDSRSTYEPVPTLRIFKQPVDLLPPPPHSVRLASGQQLDPAYVDPVAGQTKVSRTGKTLYVRPVEDLEEGVDLSHIEDDTGLFEESRTAPHIDGLNAGAQKTADGSRAPPPKDGEKLGKFREVKGVRLYAERGVTFWRFNLEVELGARQTRIAYRINRGPEIGFWVPAQGESMNIMFYSCNGFSLSVDPNGFCGPDPMWRDVLNNHQTRPFHVMIGGGDQIYNDAAMRQTKHFQEWTLMKNPAHKHSAQFTDDMQEELEDFYLHRYGMWFSQGLFGMAASQIPMINMWDDHDIIDGFGSYPHHFMSTAVFTGLGAVAFKYYMLYQHHTVPEETDKEEPSWLLGSAPGPYINQLSRSVFMFLGKKVAFLGLDCRTERMRDLILSDDTYDLIFDRCRREIIKGETQHLLVLLGVPIAYPRLNFLENVLTSRVMDPIKALGRAGLFGNFVNKFDGGVEVLDDLDDHWTAKHHKGERNWFIQELQELAAEKSVRITILGGDVHLAAVGQFFSNKKLGIPKDRDHRYMPNVISSAIVNTPPPDMLADVLNRRNKIHHLDQDTDEDMIPLFLQDVDGKPRNNKRLLPRRNWCSIREYMPSSTPPDSPSERSSPSLPPTDPSYHPPGQLKRSLSDRMGVRRRLSKSERAHPPVTFATQNFGRFFPSSRRNSMDSAARRSSTSAIPDTGSNRNSFQLSHAATSASGSLQDPGRPNPFHRRPTSLSLKETLKAEDLDPRAGHINLEGGLDIVLNVEVSQKDPSGITTPYRLLVPALDYRGDADDDAHPLRRRPKRARLLGGMLARGRSIRNSFAGRPKGVAGWDSENEEGRRDSRDSFRRLAPPPAAPPLQIPQQQPQMQQLKPQQTAAVVGHPSPSAAAQRAVQQERRAPGETPVMSATYTPGSGAMYEREMNYGFGGKPGTGGAGGAGGAAAAAAAAAGGTHEDEMDDDEEDTEDSLMDELDGPRQARRKSWKFWTG